MGYLRADDSRLHNNSVLYLPGYKSDEQDAPQARA